MTRVRRSHRGWSVVNDAPVTFTWEDGEVVADESSHTYRISGIGYDQQVCTTEPLTDVEIAALHDWYQTLTKREDDQAHDGPLAQDSGSLS